MLRKSDLGRHVWIGYLTIKVFVKSDSAIVEYPCMNVPRVDNASLVIEA